MSLPGPQFPKIVAKTKSELAYEHIKASIISLELKPGDRINITAAAQMMGISEIPVREALTKLHSEGLVTMTPYIGFQVSKVSNKEILEKLEIKAELEVMATRMAAGKIDREGIETIEVTLGEMREAQQNREHLRYYHLYQQYALGMYKYAGNESLCSAIQTLFAETHAIATIYTLVPAWGAYSIRSHSRIWEMVKHGDADGAATLMREVKTRSVKQALEGLERLAEREE